MFDNFYLPKLAEPCDIFKRQHELKLVKEEGEIQEWVEDLKMKRKFEPHIPPPDDSLNLGAGQFETESRHQEE